MILLTEAASQLYRDGLINEDYARTTEQRAVSILQQPGAHRWWTSAQDAYTPAFSKHINARLADADRPPPFDQVLPWMAPDEREA